MARFRFAEQDHERYGDQWFQVDVFNPAEIESGVLEQWEESTGYRLFGDYTDILQTRSIKAMRAMCWLAYLIGGGEFGWGEFQPQVHLIEWDSGKAGETEGEAAGPNRATRRAGTKTRSKAAASGRTSTPTTSA